MSAKTKVPKAPAPKKLDIEVDAAALDIIAKVRTYDKDIRSFQSKAKQLSDDMTKIAEGTDEYTEVLKLNAQLETARANLKRRLAGNSAWIKLSEELAEERLSITDAQNSMSDFLLVYFADTKEKQIEFGPHEAKEVILRARLGKAKDFQTNLFSASAQEATSE